MAVDEFWFHWNRGLGKWEKLGHPLDTLTVILCFSWARFVPPRSGFLGYVLLSIFSCLFVTKDEWIHKRECTASEGWLHALLFLVHSAMLIALGSCYLQEDHLDQIKSILSFQISLLIGFALYQLLYWNSISTTRPLDDN